MLSVLQNAGVPIHDGKIQIDPSIKKVKLDIGLSYNAPQMQNWLSKEAPDLLVFGFEPNPTSVARIISPTNTKKEAFHGDVLEHRFLHKNAYILPIALSEKDNKDQDFYISTVDEGCSSLYQPSDVLFSTKEIIRVPVFTLKSFFDMFPFDKIPLIEYIKIDAQGADLEILKGAGEYLSNHVVFITAESEVNNFYKDVKYNDTNLVREYLQSQGFFQIRHPLTEDPTFLNFRFREEASNIYIFQSG